MARNGALGAKTLRLHRTAKEIVSQEEYEQAVRALVAICLNENEVTKVRLNAIQTLMAYIEGRPKEQVEHTITTGLSAKEVLSGLVETERTD